jgi:hypothetical protein
MAKERFRRVAIRTGAMAIASLLLQGVGGFRADAAVPKPRPAPTGVITKVVVTSSSVMAIAYVYFTSDPGVITVQWGDGKLSTRDPLIPLSATAIATGVPSDPSGGVALLHEYAVPRSASGAPQNPGIFVVSAATVTSSAFAKVGVEALYELVQSPVMFRPLDHCDALLDPVTEWDVTLVSRIPGIVAPATWHMELSTIYPLLVPTFELPGSALRHAANATASTWGFLNGIGFVTSEIDATRNETAPEQGYLVSGGGTLGPPGPRVGARHATFVLQNSAACRSQIDVDLSVSLLRPGAPVTQLQP